MSKSAKTTKSGSIGSDAVPYEEAIEKLESILDELETEDLSLEKLLSRFKEGKRMVGTCHKKLAEAELEVRQLEKKASGEFELKDVTIGDSNE